MRRISKGWGHISAHPYLLAYALSLSPLPWTFHIPEPIISQPIHTYTFLHSSMSYAYFRRALSTLHKEFH